MSPRVEVYYSDHINSFTYLKDGVITTKL